MTDDEDNNNDSVLAGPQKDCCDKMIDNETYCFYVKPEQQQKPNTKYHLVLIICFSILLFLFLICYTILPILLWFILPYDWNDMILFRILVGDTDNNNEMIIKQSIVEWINHTIPKCITSIFMIHMIQCFIYITWEKKKKNKNDNEEKTKKKVK